MGLATSKDASGHVVLPGGAPGGLPPDSLDYAGRELRDRLDECLNANMWYATGLGLALAVPVTIKYKTQKPLFAAALISPLADMTYSARRRRRRRPPTRRNACCSLARPTWRSRPPRQTAPAAPGGGHGSRLRVPHSVSLAAAAAPSFGRHPPLRAAEGGVSGALPRAAGPHERRRGRAGGAAGRATGGAARLGRRRRPAAVRV